MIKTVDDAEQLLRSYIPKSPLRHSYKLERMRNFLDFLGNPQEELRIVHIAGTSGKTSTAYFIRALSQAAGVRTGLTVSPHMDSITERIQIDGAPIPAANFVRHFNTFLPLLKESGLQPSYFEIMIAFTFWVFVREKVDLAIIETGLGGLLDATNTVQRADKLCVITDIGLDHTEILGETIAEIAVQKAGIIQQGNTVVVLEQPAEALDVITKMAASKKAELTLARPADNFNLSPFQQRNFGAALAAYKQLGLPALTNKQLQKAALRTPPGRLEFYKIGTKTLILDGAHNAQKLQALHQALVARGVKKTSVLCNMVSAPPHKISAAINALLPFAREIIVPEFSIAQDFNNRYALPAADFARQIADTGTPAHTVSSISTALNELLASPHETIVVTGSLYLVQEVRLHLRNLS